MEDQEDVRRMLITALEMEGHEVDEAATALEGLSCLESQKYQLVLSDYAMPGGTGAWMLTEATERGLMDGTAALLVTAHPDVGRTLDVQVITKPVELDQFLRQVQMILSPNGVDPEPAAFAHDEGRPHSTTPDDHRVELVLYVSPASPASSQARHNLERLLEGFDGGQVRFSLVDLERDPMAGDADRIAFTPTLVKRSPGPKMWVLGNLREPQVIIDILRACGVDARERT